MTKMGDYPEDAYGNAAAAMEAPRVKVGPRTTLRFVVDYVPLASILPNLTNPRKHSRQQIDAIAHSIEAFGFNAPILVASSEPQKTYPLVSQTESA